MTTEALAAHTVLDTDFADGAQFFARWHQWRRASAPGAMLHYVGLQATPVRAQPPQTNAVQAQEWARACEGLEGLSGFYRLLLDGGRVSLTLCLGDPLRNMAQLALQADAIYLGVVCAQATALAALARCCQRGTRVTCTPALHATGGPNAAALHALGFQTRTSLDWVFDPAWPVLRSRQTPRHPWCQAGHCTVIGAGLSGASVARALALRGWQVAVLDAQAHPASGASGLPAGLVSPVHSADDGPVSQLTRCGGALMRQHAQALLAQGQDWAPSGAWLRQGADDPRFDSTAARCLPQAFWLRPAALVRAWLATPGVIFKGQTRVNQVERQGEHWVCQDDLGRELARSELLVIANALDAPRLLNAPGIWGNGVAAPSPITPTAAIAQALARLHPRYGSVSMGASARLPGVPAQPVQGHGTFLPAVPQALGSMWLAGAGFDPVPERDAAAQHRANLNRLRELLPQAAAALAPQFDAGQVHLWQGQRCVSHDRLPLVGPVQAAPDASVWISAAQGARGLTLAALCAELLAARIGGEPLPLPLRLTHLLDAQRAARRTA